MLILSFIGCSVDFATEKYEYILKKWNWINKYEYIQKKKMKLN